MGQEYQDGVLEWDRNVMMGNIRMRVQDGTEILGWEFQDGTGILRWSYRMRQEYYYWEYQNRSLG